jgi:DNA polymerase III sliding clamp (beta) subunit (PCNA family)
MSAITIQREELIRDLDQVKPGLSSREFIEQSSCFCFQDGVVMTFNDEIACRKRTVLPINGAIQAQVLRDILDKLPDAELTVEEGENGEVIFKGKRRAFGMVKDAEIHLPINQVENPSEDQWKPLPKTFLEALKLVRHCVSTDESKFLLTCIHLTPKGMESCDNLQMIRYRFPTGLTEKVLVRGSSLSQILDLGMESVCLTPSWIHFRNESGLVLSCRRFADEYPDLSPLTQFEGYPIRIPQGLKEASERAAVFARDRAGDPLIEVTLREDRIRLEGRGLSGWYREVKRVQYRGPELRFFISPDLLAHLSEHYSDAQISDERLKVEGENWVYVTVLGKPNAEEREKAE